jgi:hypothetical protein
MRSGTGTFRAGTFRCRYWKPGTGRSLKGDRAEALLILEFFVFFSEPLDAAGRIHQLLLAGKKRVTLGTDFHAYVLFRGTHLEGAAASTLDGRCGIIRMDVGFHFNFNPL